MMFMPDSAHGVFFHGVTLMSPSILSLSIQPTELDSIRPGNTSVYLKCYSLESVFFPHLQGADVCVAAGAVPVAFHWFGVQRCNNSEIFTHPVQQVTGNPEVVGHVDALTGAHLELPLQTKVCSRHEERAPRVISALRSLAAMLISTWDGITSALVPQILTPA